MMNKFILALLLSSCTVPLAAMDRGGGGGGEGPRKIVRVPGPRPMGPPPPPPPPLRRYSPAGEMKMCEPVEMDADEHDAAVPAFTREQVDALFNAVERAEAVAAVRALINAVPEEHRLAFLAQRNDEGSMVLDIAYEQENYDLMRAIGAYIPDPDEDEEMG